jgi:hypothetical protein
MLRVLRPYNLGGSSINGRVNDPNGCFLSHLMKAIAKLRVNHDSNFVRSINHF